jgi:hypothetical protein
LLGNVVLVLLLLGSRRCRAYCGRTAYLVVVVVRAEVAAAVFPHGGVNDRRALVVDVEERSHDDHQLVEGHCQERTTAFVTSEAAAINSYY